MSVFLIAEIEITDDAWVGDYAASVHGLVEKHGGRYLARSGNITTLEGTAKSATLVALLRFPSEEALKRFVKDPEYAEHGRARRAGSISNFYMIDDSDIAGTIPYLPAG